MATTVYYAQAYQVANRLNLTTASGDPFDATNIAQIVNPTKDTIDEFIEEAETDINKATGRSWKSVAIIDYEYSDFTFRDYRKGRHTRWGRIQHIINTIFDDIISVETLEILTGDSTWVDLIATGTEGESGYDPDGDYFIQGSEGKIYLLGDLPLYGYDNIRIKYTYGKTVVPPDIRKVTVMRAAQQVIDYLPDMFIKAEGEVGGISYGMLQSRWEKEIKRITDRYNRESFKPLYL